VRVGTAFGAVTVLLTVLAAPAWAQYVYTPPEQLDDGWTVASLSDVGMNEETIVKLTDKILNGTFEGIHSMIVIKDGLLVHEVYVDGYDRESLQRIYSITKSVTSALIGIAIEEEFIKSVDEPVHTFFPQYADAFDDPKKREITLEHILTLTSGLDWVESEVSYGDPRNDQYHQVRSDDWVEYVVDRPVADEPGTRWVYNTGSVHLLSAVIKKASGVYANEFIEKYLFEPLGITEFEWNTDPQGYQCTGGTHGGLRMKARDVAKIGSVFLNEGKWHGRQVVPRRWVDESTKPRFETAFGSEMGYLWWSRAFKIKGRPLDFIFAAGYGGQSLHISPELNLIIGFLCWDNPEDALIFAPTLMTYKAVLEN
jgi:CubicO group peptidase (beta-lactamase class C family)